MLSSVKILVLFAVTLSAAAQTSKQTVAPTPTSKASHIQGHKLPNKNIPNFGQVTPNLYRGGQPTLEGMESLKKLGVDIVVDMRGGRQEVENKIADKLGMRYISIPSHCPFPTDKPWAQFLAVIRDNPDRKIFVHCRLGDDRTGLAIASYRIADEGWTAAEALNEMKTFGFSGVHHAICPGLESYVESFPERLKKDSAFKDLQTGAEKSK
jgi:tyrosine-protein phosphatase SIW14